MKRSSKTQTRRVTLSFDVNIKYESPESMGVIIASLSASRMPKFDIEGVDEDLGYYSIKSVDGTAKVF